MFSIWHDNNTLKIFILKIQVIHLSDAELYNRREMGLQFIKGAELKDYENKINTGLKKNN